MRNIPDARLRDGHTRFLLIALLFSLAVTQPLFDLLGEQAEFFVTYGMNRGSLLLFTLALAILLPLVIASLPALFGALRPRLGRAAFQFLQGLLWLLIFLPPASRAGLEGMPAVAASAALAAVCVFAYAAFYPVRLTLLYLAPAMVIFPLVFLFASNITQIVLPRSADVDPSRHGATVDKDIVFIVLDEFPLASLLTPDMEIDRLRYPNFGRLADVSVWFRGATTPSEITTDAVPVALSGLGFQDVHGALPIHANVPRNLFTLLATSHHIKAIETSTLLCPESVCRKYGKAGERGDFLAHFSADLLIIYAHLVAPRPYSENLPSISHAWAGFGLRGDAPKPVSPAGASAGTDQLASQIKQQERWGDRAEEFEQFIDGIRKSSRPQLFYLHSLLPHSEWVYLPDGRTYIFNRDRVNFGIRPDDDPQSVYFHEWYADSHAVNQAWQRHLLQVQFVDSLLGQLLDRLVSENMFDDALIVVMADHGASFVPGRSRRAADQKSLSDIAAVPLFIKFPGSTAGAVEDAPAVLADILPTMAAALGLETGWPFSGSDLRDRQGLEGREFVTIHQSNGTPVRYPFATHRAHLQARAKDLDAVFGSGENSRLFNFGPFPDLVGKAVDSAGSGAPAEGELVLEGAGLLHDIDPGADFLPLQLWGRWSGMRQDRLPGEIAIALNGVIVTTTRTYEIPGYHDFFSAMLPPQALTRGHNQLQVFAISGTPDRPLLSEVAQADRAPARLFSSAQGERLVLAEGLEYPVRDDFQPGEVETVMDQNGTLAYVQGAVAVGPEDDLWVLVVRNGMSTDGAEMGAVQAPDQGGRGLSNFRFPVVYLDEASAASTGLRVFAVDKVNKVAGELQYPPLCSPRWIYAPPRSWGIDDCNRLHADLPTFAGGEYRVVLQFSQESIRQYMGEGWRVERNNPSWTVGNRAELRLPLPEFAGDWTFQATLKPFLAAGKLERQRLALSVGADTLAEWKLDQEDFVTIEWSVPGQLARTGSPLELVFSLPDASSPHQLGAGADQGKLGVAVLRLVISNHAGGELE